MGERERERREREKGVKLQAPRKGGKGERWTPKGEGRYGGEATDQKNEKEIKIPNIEEK